MPTSLQQPLTTATTSTFEGLGLVMALGASPDAGAPPRAVQVRFRGPRTGRLELRVTDGLLAAVSANMLGVHGPPAPELQGDALGELANVIAGAVVPALDGPLAIYRLDTPAACASPGAEAPVATARIAFDEGDAVAALYVDGMEVA